MGDTIKHAQTILQAEAVLKIAPEMMVKWDRGIANATDPATRRILRAGKERDVISFDLIQRLLEVIYDT